MIKNIVFDLGNVILNIDASLSVLEFEKLQLKNFDELYTLSNQVGLFDQLEKGEIEPEEFYAKIREISKLDLKDFEIINAWNALILDFPKENIELLKSLKSKYRTFILSNTNYIHYKYYTEQLQTNFNINGLEDLVEKAYFSHELGYRKPDEIIYKFVENHANIKPEETLFIDDNAENCLSAEKLSWKTILYTGNSLSDLFAKLNLPRH
ncbi:MAG: HAD family phosphatase [Bacteroidales bacterium]|nr:HAD family phosphatase [Bacteroidales bacterium]